MATNVTIDDSAQNGIVVTVTGATTVVGQLPHASTHESGGSDELLLDISQVDGLQTELNAKLDDSQAGAFGLNLLFTTTANEALDLLPHASRHAAAGSDPLTLSISQTTGLQTALDNKLDDSQAGAFGLSLLGTTTSTAALNLLPHAARHAAAGADPLTLSISQITSLQSTLDAKLDDSQATSFGLSILGAADATAATALLPHASRHATGGSDELTLDIDQIFGLQTELDDKLDDSQAGTVGLQVLSANEAWVAREYGAMGMPSTGIISGGALSINAGDNTKFDISAFRGLYVDSTVPYDPTLTTVTVSARFAESVTDIATQPVTYVGVDNMGLVVQRSSPFTNTQRRTIIPLGLIIHSNNVNINLVNSLTAPVSNSIAQLGDLMLAIGPLNTLGNTYSANGANLLLNKTSGQLFKYGSNFHVDTSNPHQSTQASGSGITLRYRRQNSAESADTTSVDPNNYDVSGTLTAVPINKFTVQRINMFQSGVTRIQYGQTLYDTLADAEAGIRTQSFVTEPNIRDNGILRAMLVVKQGTTNLQTTTDAKFIEVTRFGSSLSSIGGVNL